MHFQQKDLLEKALEIIATSTSSDAGTVQPKKENLVIQTYVGLDEKGLKMYEDFRSERLYSPPLEVKVEVTIFFFFKI